MTKIIQADQLHLVTMYERCLCFDLSLPSFSERGERGNQGEVRKIIWVEF